MCDLCSCRLLRAILATPFRSEGRLLATACHLGSHGPIRDDRGRGVHDTPVSSWWRQLPWHL